MSDSALEEGGEEEMELERDVLAVDVLDWRLRKGSDGTR